MTRPSPKTIVVNTTKRDTVIGIIAGVVLFGLLLMGFMQLSKDVVGKGLTGIITSKTFTPQPEEQITIGQGGVHERKIDGEYRFEVNVESKIYTIWVDKFTYDSHNIGDRFYFMRPPNKPR